MPDIEYLLEALSHWDCGDANTWVADVAFRGGLPSQSRDACDLEVQTSCREGLSQRPSRGSGPTTCEGLDMVCAICGLPIVAGYAYAHPFHKPRDASHVICAIAESAQALQCSAG